jgi:hypothetical protein
MRGPLVLDVKDNGSVVKSPLWPFVNGTIVYKSVLREPL